MSPKRLAEYAGYCSGLGHANVSNGSDNFKQFKELFPESEEETLEVQEERCEAAIETAKRLGDPVPEGY